MLTFPPLIVNLIWLHIVQAHTCSHISSASTLYMSWASTQCALQFLCDAASNFRTDFCMERLCSFRRSTARRECPWSQYKICIFLFPSSFYSIIMAKLYFEASMNTTNFAEILIVNGIGVCLMLLLLLTSTSK